MNFKHIIFLCKETIILNLENQSIIKTIKNIFRQILKIKIKKKLIKL